VPLLEETGLILPVGRWVLQTACSYARTLQSAGVGRLRIAVNLSPRQLRDSGLVEFTRACLDRLELDGSVLELEITEGLLIEHTGTAVTTLETLHDLGVQISIDDFGTGYAALAYLKRFPIDGLKIDRSFINDVPSSSDDQAIVRAIVAMARSLGYRTTAEGVETAEQLALLRTEGCDELQGFYFSRPLNAGELDAWLSKR
jgi:EAL domain-containing protein (putative c-di-GMP-specific phosphodiesterase class I)